MRTHFRAQIFMLFILFTIVSLNCKKEFVSDETDDHGNPPPPPADTLKLHPDKPNIILILGEEMGYETVTVNGGESYQTPNLDNLAKIGMRFTQCHGNALCAPSRVMLMTGKYNFRNYTFYGRLNDDQKTFANMLKDAGYKTGIYGKWAMDGGDTAIRKFGFDNYLIWNPYKVLPGEESGSKGSHYKNPVIYHNADFIDTSLTTGKYGDDIFVDSVFNFMEVHKEEPFFAYYTMTLSHGPSSPTPDDPEFNLWNPKDNIDDARFFPSMVKYADKKVGQIIDKVNSMGIGSETIVIVLFGDNGTREGITSMYHGVPVAGGRLNATEHGTHVPMFVYWPGKVAAGAINEDLVSFVDILPTLADVAKISKPTSYGPLDGVSFYNRMVGLEGKPREWIFNHYQPFINVEGNTKLYRWVQNKDYKLYDTTDSRLLSGKFFKMTDFQEDKDPLNADQLTAEERALKDSFRVILSRMHN